VVAVRDRAAERAVLGALDVDVDPLVVARHAGELVDRLLRDEVPVAHSELLADVIVDLVESGECEHRLRPSFAGLPLRAPRAPAVPPTGGPRPTRTASRSGRRARSGGRAPSPARRPGPCRGGGRSGGRAP